MIGNRLLRLALSKLLSLSGRETGISAFLVVDHFPFAFSLGVFFVFGPGRERANLILSMRARLRIDE
jgi:hypothetical protein